MPAVTGRPEEATLIQDENPKTGQKTAGPPHCWETFSAAVEKSRQAEKLNSSSSSSSSNTFLSVSTLGTGDRRQTSSSTEPEKDRPISNSSGVDVSLVGEHLRLNSQRLVVNV